MLNRKINGSYYTPANLANYLVNYIFKEYDLNKKLNVLEPSCGDGIFLSALLDNDRFLEKEFSKVDIVEKNLVELEKAIRKKQTFTNYNIELNSHNMDYLEYEKNSKDKRYDLILGNPPYIQRKILTDEQIKLSENAMIMEKFKKHTVMNIWMPFVVSAVRLLHDRGIMCFVLPSEILQVNYASEIRAYLNENLDEIEIFAFDELIFKEIEQDVVVLIGVKKSSRKGINFHQVKRLESLDHKENLKQEVIVHPKTNDKWTKLYLTEEELILIDKIKTLDKLKVMDNYCCSQVGIVTGANSFFITNKDIVNKYYLKKYARPIIKKSSYLANSIKITEQDFDSVLSQGKDCYLISFNKSNTKRMGKNAKLYLQYGIDEKIDQGYKCKKRSIWYEVPSVWSSEGVFFKRCHKYPKIASNKFSVLVTDTAYRITMKENYDINILVFCFYNSFTLLFSEIQGRYYGGGVLELTPGEFKNLLVPYTIISQEKLDHLDNMFRNGMDIDIILDYTDKILLKDFLGLDQDTIQKIKNIRKKLLMRRLKKELI